VAHLLKVFLFYSNNVWLVCATMALLLTACVPSPVVPTATGELPQQGGVYVVCEGLWHQNNGTLTYVQPSGTVIPNVAAAVQPGYVLGDTPSGVAVIADTMLVVVSSSNTIEKFVISTGKWLGRYSRTQGGTPYGIAMVSDSVAVVSLLAGDGVMELNTRTMKPQIERLATGPAPEGVASFQGMTWVANSGFGDLRNNELNAGTVMVFSARDFLLRATIAGLPNVQSVHINAQTNQAWICYRNLPSLRDSLGGIVVVDGGTFQARAHYRYGAPRLALAPDGTAFVLHTTGVDKITNDGVVRPIIAHQSGSGNDVWYSIAYRKGAQPQLWIGNAKNYVQPGQVFVFTEEGSLLHTYDVAINPAHFVFTPPAR
jgi:hypothetical protein